MKQKRVTAIALICGLACALCVFLFMWSIQHQVDEDRAQMLARYGGEQVAVCVAARDIAAGERVDVSSLETRLWVASLLPDDAICDEKEAIGKTVTTSIMKGEVIVAKRFRVAASDLDIPPGYQAVSVPVKAVQAVGGSVNAGMRVDVYATGDTSTTALVTNVLVLDASIGKAESLTSSGNGWITLAIEPKRVQEVVAAANRTNLYLTIPGEQAAANAETSSVQKSSSHSSQNQPSIVEAKEKEGSDVSNSGAVSR